MPSIPPDAIADIQPLNRLARIRLWRPDQHVVMIIHQHIGMDLYQIPLHTFRHQVNKVFPIVRIIIYRIPVMPARRDVIPPAFDIYP